MVSTQRMIWVWPFLAIMWIAMSGWLDGKITLGELLTWIGFVFLSIVWWLIGKWKHRNWFISTARSEDWKYRFLPSRKLKVLYLETSVFPHDFDFNLIVRARGDTRFSKFSKCDVSFVEPVQPAYLIERKKDDYPRAPSRKMEITFIRKCSSGGNVVEHFRPTTDSENGKVGKNVDLAEEARIAWTAPMFLKISLRVNQPWSGAVSFKAQDSLGETRYGRSVIVISQTPILDTPTSPPE